MYKSSLKTVGNKKDLLYKIAASGLKELYLIIYYAFIWSFIVGLNLEPFFFGYFLNYCLRKGRDLGAVLSFKMFVVTFVFFFFFRSVFKIFLWIYTYTILYYIYIHIGWKYLGIFIYFSVHVINLHIYIFNTYFLSKKDLLNILFQYIDVSYNPKKT